MLDQHNPDQRRPKRHYFFLFLLIAVAATVFFAWPILAKTVVAIALDLVLIGGFWWVVLSLIFRRNGDQGMKNMERFAEKKTKK